MQFFQKMTATPVLLLVFVGCCGSQAAAQGTIANDTLKMVPACVSPALRADAPSFKVKPVALHTAYYNHLGFMCRQELKLEKATKTSFRVRLGSVEYTDRMEGKGKPVTLR